MVATYRSSDTSPKERFVHQQAGDGGYGGSSYIDLLAFREKDANTAWTSASDGTLEERLYYCQNQHADVVALITAAGTQREMDRYSAYGVPFGLPVGDVDSDGACLIADQNQVRDWAIASPPVYDVRGDLDLDGDVDLTDRNTLRDEFKGVTLGRGVLSAGAVGNRWGDAGYEIGLTPTSRSYFVRNRLLASDYGRWVSRDQLGYLSQQSLYEYVGGQPITSTDILGYFETKPGDPPPTGGGGGGSSSRSTCAASMPNPEYGGTKTKTHLALGLEWGLDIKASCTTKSASGMCGLGICNFDNCTVKLVFQVRIPGGMWKALDGSSKRPAVPGNPLTGSAAFFLLHGQPYGSKPPNDGVSKYPEWTGNGPGTRPGGSEQTITNLQFTTWCPSALTLVYHAKGSPQLNPPIEIEATFPLYCDCSPLWAPL